MTILALSQTGTLQNFTVALLLYNNYTAISISLISTGYLHCICQNHPPPQIPPTYQIQGKIFIKFNLFDICNLTPNKEGLGQSKKYVTYL